MLLPLAADTNAIVLCDARNTDVLSNALAEVMPLFTAKFGGKLPFTVLATTPATWMEYNMLHNPDSLICELANKSRNWRTGITKFERLVPKHYGDQPKEKWARDDLQPGLGNYIIVEGISGRSPDTWKADSSPLVTFQNELLQALSAQLPTLCVRTGGSSGSVPMTANVELGSRDIPLLMLDTQPRPSLGVNIDSADPEEQENQRDELITKAIDENLKRHQGLWA
eukprot:COSAG04_NODE_9238_length_884_cov_0.923567_1_plen_224_part_01